LKIDHSSTSWFAIPGVLKIAGGIAAACTTLLAAAPAMADTVVSGQSDTIIRMGQTVDKKDIYPAYEYLRLSATTVVKDGSAISLHVGGWARVDMAEKSARDRYVDADLQYGYLSYQGAKNNLIINAGRQFVTEGVAAQRLDGVFLRNDFAAGFAAAAYVGSPVVTEPNFKADDFVFGGRVTQSNYKYYTLGVSALKSFSGSARYREEEGVDLWLHPIKQVDLTGRSSYNSITNGWMEHAYAVSYTPIDSLRLSVDISNINYKDYFYKVTTSALVFNPLTNGIDPNEKALAAGGSVSYAINKNFTLVGDFRNFSYDIAKSANYFGGKATYSLQDSFAAGFSIHRMEGHIDRLNFYEYRVFASKKLGKADLALDVIDINYENAGSMNNVRNALTIVAASSYELIQRLKIGADIEYSKNPFFDNEVKGLVKLTYLFDTKHAAEGGTKSEK
jgi:hypothetical protein